MNMSCPNRQRRFIFMPADVTISFLFLSVPVIWGSIILSSPWKSWGCSQIREIGCIRELGM
jgi:hypothetical protein